MTETTKETRDFCTPREATILRAAVAAMLEEPRRANMFCWLETGLTKDNPGTVSLNFMRSKDRRPSQVPPCGTVGCIAGWVTALHPKPTGKIRKSAKSVQLYLNEAAISAAIMRDNVGALERLAESVGQGDYLFTEVHNEAAKLLSSQRYSALFMPDQWPTPFNVRLSKANPGTKKYVRVIAARVEHFIKTGE